MVSTGGMSPPQESNILDYSQYTHKKDAEKLYNRIISEIKQSACGDDIDCDIQMDYKKWTQILCDLLKKVVIENVIVSDEYVRSIVRQFILRAITFWNTIETISAEEVERLLFDQALLLEQLYIDEVKENCHES